MFKCPKCGESVHYIELHGEIVECDKELVEVITERGNVIKGYQRHVCGRGHSGRCGGDKKGSAEMSA